VSGADDIPGAAPGPRIRPLGPADWGEDVEEMRRLIERHPLAERLGVRADPGRMFSIMARRPDLFRPWLVFTTEIRLAQRLSLRHRELMVLRVAWHCRAAYAWGQHVRLALEAGFTHAEIEAVTVGPGAVGWAEDERAVLRATDELHASGTITDETWERLTRHLDVEQLIELPMVVGWYHLIVFVHRALRVPLEAGVDGLDAR
jgi:alkylhydroperoxidase family enzyme